MKNTLKIVLAIALVLSVVIVREAFAAITLTGTIPTGQRTVVIIPANGQTGARGTLKFLFSAPTAGAYSLSFCIGPAANPCGTPGAYIVNVPGGQQRLAVVDASFFVDKVLVVGQGTSVALPFSVTVE